MYYYVYVLLSEKDNQFYTGYTADLKQRLNFHNDGKVDSTKNRRPLKLIYFEGCLNQQDATRREKYLKSGSGKIYLRSRLNLYLTLRGRGIIGSHEYSHHHKVYTCKQKPISKIQSRLDKLL